MAKTALDAWHYHTARLAPEVLRDPVASALKKLAEQVFVEYERELTQLRSQHGEEA